MTFTFAPAVRTSTPMIIGIAGPSGSGKTFTALTLAMGLAGDGRIALIDTEGRRALHYADLKGADGAPLFRFDHCDMQSPYTPANFLAVLKQAESTGYAVIVVDSFSDEYVGEGGLVDMADAEKVDNQAAKWARPKAQHKLVIRWLRQSRCHVIFCLRAEEKVRLERVFNERKNKEETVVVPIGWQPICEKNVPYEMATSFMLTPEAPGVPRPIKIQEQHRPLFPTDRPITRESGVALAAWCAGGAARKIDARAPAEPAGERPLDRAYSEARKGLWALEVFWSDLRGPDRRELWKALEANPKDGCPAQLKAIAEQADNSPLNHAESADVPSAKRGSTGSAIGNEQNPAVPSRAAGAPSGSDVPQTQPEGATSRDPVEYLNA